MFSEEVFQIIVLCFLHTCANGQLKRVIIQFWLDGDKHGANSDFMDTVVDAVYIPLQKKKSEKNV